MQMFSCDIQIATKPYLHLQITVYDIGDDESTRSIDEAILTALLKGSLI